MTKLNLFLALILIACALGVVTSQHKARKLFVELEKEQKLARQLAVEWGQLQLEQSTWAMHARIEKIAAGQLRMKVPGASRIQIVSPQSGINSVAPVEMPALSPSLSDVTTSHSTRPLKDNGQVAGYPMKGERKHLLPSPLDGEGSGKR